MGEYPPGQSPYELLVRMAMGGENLEEVKERLKKCACGETDAGRCYHNCNRPCPACGKNMLNGLCVYCDGKDYSDL